MFEFFRGTSNSEGLAQLRELDDIDILTQGDGVSLMLFNQHQGMYRIVCCADWTNWQGLDFKGFTRAEALRTARAYMEKHR